MWEREWLTQLEETGNITEEGVSGLCLEGLESSRGLPGQTEMLLALN